MKWSIPYHWVILLCCCLTAHSLKFYPTSCALTQQLNTRIFYASFLIAILTSSVLKYFSIFGHYVWTFNLCMHGCTIYFTYVQLSLHYMLNILASVCAHNMEKLLYDGCVTCLWVSIGLSSSKQSTLKF